MNDKSLLLDLQGILLSVLHRDEAVYPIIVIQCEIVCGGATLLARRTQGGMWVDDLKS